MDIASLHSALSGRLSADHISLDHQLILEGQVADFLSTLPGGVLVLTNAVLSCTGAYPLQLVLEGTASDGWQLATVNNARWSCVTLRLSWTQLAAGAPVVDALSVRNSTLHLGPGCAATMAGELRADQLLHLHLQGEQGEPEAAITLETVISFAQSPSLAYLVPPLPPFQSGQVKVLELIFGFAATSPRTFRFASFSGQLWTIVGNLALKEVGFAVTTKSEMPLVLTAQPAVHAAVSGILHIGQDFGVWVRLQSPTSWELEVVPASGNLLPSLEDLGDFIEAGLGQKLRQALALVDLDEIGIDGVKIGFDYEAKKLLYVLLRSYITLAGIRFNVTTQLPDFQLTGTLAPGTTISLKSVVAHYFVSAAKFPEVKITKLLVAMTPGKGIYSLALAITDEWMYETSAGRSLTLSSVAAEIQKSPSELMGSVTAVLGLAGVGVQLAAAYGGPGQGWRFQGSTSPRQAIPIENLIKDLVTLFGVTYDFPKALDNLIITDITVDFTTSTSDFHFSCELKFPVQGHELDLTVDIALAHVDGNYEKTFKGQLLLAGRQFDLDFDTGGDTTTFWGNYENTGGQELAVRGLLALLTTDADLLAATQGLKFDLKDAFAGYLKGSGATDPAKWLLGLDMNFGADLTALPLVGKFIPKDEALRLAFQPRIATAAFSAPELTALKALISGSAIALPETFDKGLTLHTELSLGTTVVPMALPIALNNGTLTDQPATTAPPAGSTPAPADKATWFKLQKSFGPLQLQRVGVQYESGQLTFLLDGGFSVAGLTIALTGLSATTSLNPFELSFGLEGLALDYQGGPVEISGAFLREQLIDPVTGPYTEYDGAALIKAESFSLSAIGSYAEYQGHPSLFIYAVLDYPLGGPAFFFVTGLAAGFGFNRALKAPGIDQVRQFPLVAQAVDGPPSGNLNISTQLSSLHTYIPPAVGEYFLAVGIRFTTFKIIDSFALLIVSLGSSVEIDLLGLSTLVLPAQTEGAMPPLAELQMALKASYLPAVGFLGVEAKLTPASFLFSHDCHLTGGFAFYTWFAGEHKDDFAVTLGGYHPSYQRPAHFPVVDKLAFNWALSDRLTIKGDAYFALVPSMVMAGTHLSAVWEDGDLSAWFNAGADFLVAWKPYHYDAQIYVDMGVSYTYHFFGTHHISVDVGADLHIWGPEFAGTARVHLWIVSFTVDFGSSNANGPAPISWTEFQQSFLPDPAKVCSLAVKQGLEKKEDQGADAHPVVNAKNLVLNFNSLVPLKSASWAVGDAAAQSLPRGNTNWGIGPMGLAAPDVASDVVVTVKATGGQFISADHLVAVPVFKAVPAALWGQSVSPTLNGQHLIEGAVCGFDISGVAPTPDCTAFIECEKLESGLEQASSAWHWASAPASGATAAEQLLNAPGKEIEADRREYLRTHLEAVQAQRNELLQQLGYGTPVFPNQSLAQAFVFAPQLV